MNTNLNKSKQIVVLGGKGGTGKTTVTSALAKLFENKIVVDCDVDAANLHLILDYEINHSYDYIGSKKAFIDKSLCVECGFCESLCRFDAIENFAVDTIACEGCGLCYRACPENAIQFNESVSGTYNVCELNDRSKFLFARLKPGEGNSGKLVSEIKNKAAEFNDEEVKLILIDGPPGIGCPVNASLSGADYVLIVTEPTLSGFHDLKRLLILIKTFKLKTGVLINKYDLNTDFSHEITKYLLNEKIDVIGKIPFSSSIPKSLSQRINLVDLNCGMKDLLTKIKSEIEKQIITN